MARETDLAWNAFCDIFRDSTRLIIDPDGINRDKTMLTVEMIPKHM